MNYLRRIFYGRTIGTPQTQAQPNTDQVENSAGGYVYAIDPWARLDRFLVLGSESGTYYATEQHLTRENAHNLAACVREDGVRVVERIVAISHAGRAPKNDPALFALAMCAGWGDDATRRLALDRLQHVARTGSHVLQFASYVEQFRGWGRGLRRAVGEWYDAKPVGDLAYQVVKYQNRHGWSHRDLLRLAHPVAHDETRDMLYRWIAGKSDGAHALHLIDAFEQAKRMRTTDAATMAAFVREHELPREAVPSEWLREPAVWDALLPQMPMTALLRNLATMSRVGLLTPAASATQLVLERLSDAGRIAKARVHPVAVLTALMTYGSGRSVRGDTQWKPVESVVEALDAAFYLAFGNVEPSNTSVLVALDVSGSMSCGTIAGVPNLTPRVATSAMALVHARIEPLCTVMAFTGGFVPLRVRKDERLQELMTRTEALPFERTDCALPMLYALERRLAVGTFIVYTDNETWAGSIHPDEALRRYREWSGIAAKLVVVGTTATKFSIADPNDAGMLDVVGFDSATPNLIGEFIRA